jgi:hypothetical protein
LWPLEELRNLRNPPFVPDPEFTPLPLERLERDFHAASAQICSEKASRFRALKGRGNTETIASYGQGFLLNREQRSIYRLAAP